MKHNSFLNVFILEIIVKKNYVLLFYFFLVMFCVYDFLQAKSKEPIIVGDILDVPVYLTPDSEFELSISKSKEFQKYAMSYNVFFESLARSVLIEGKNFAKGKNFKFKYDFKDSEYKKLLEEYKILDIAKGKSSFEKLVNVMNYFAYRLTHGNSDIEKEKKFKGKKSKDLRAYEILKYSLDNKNHGINCNLKSRILYEIGRALGMYTRRVWTLPLDKNMNSTLESHAVMEVWDELLNKWVMLDMTSNLYWVDSKGTPLSTLELRDKFISEEKGLKAVWGSHPVEDFDLKSKYKTQKEYDLEYEASQFRLKLYYLKNSYVLKYAVGIPETQIYYLVPDNFSYKNKVSKILITKDAVEASPISK